MEMIYPYNILQGMYNICFCLRNFAKLWKKELKGILCYYTFILKKITN
jgi:hypothetical protein